MPTLRRRYASDTSPSGEMYSARIVTPASGFVIQLVAPNVSAARAGSFAPYAAGECGPAMEVSAEVEDFSSLEMQWDAYADDLRARDLPATIVAQISQPASRAGDVGRLGASPAPPRVLPLSRRDSIVRAFVPSSQASSWQTRRARGCARR